MSQFTKLFEISNAQIICCLGILQGNSLNCNTKPLFSESSRIIMAWFGPSFYSGKEWHLVFQDEIMTCQLVRLLHNGINKIHQCARVGLNCGGIIWTSFLEHNISNNIQSFDRPILSLVLYFSKSSYKFTRINHFCPPTLPCTGLSPVHLEVIWSIHHSHRKFWLFRFLVIYSTFPSLRLRFCKDIMVLL